MDCELLFFALKEFSDARDQLSSVKLQYEEKLLFVQGQARSLLKDPLG